MCRSAITAKAGITAPHDLEAGTTLDTTPFTPALRFGRPRDRPC
ncbi:MAG: hypothetical protein ACK52I_19025 [Pseudomonadota bacterium]